MKRVGRMVSQIQLLANDKEERVIELSSPDCFTCQKWVSVPLSVTEHLKMLLHKRGVQD